jgi:hypothetical protein
MGIGVSIFLLAIGAILAFALGESQIGTVNMDVVGFILMGAGALGLLLTMLVFGRRDTVGAETVVTRERDVY